MNKSKDEKVQQFLEDISSVNGDQFDILQKLREVVFNAYPNTTERMMYGGIMFSVLDDFGGIFARKNHISFEFSNGSIMIDSDQLLEGTGKFRRHLKIREMIDIKEKKIEFYVDQAIPE